MNSLLRRINASSEDVEQCISEGWSESTIISEIRRLLDSGYFKESEVWWEFMDSRQDLLTALPGVKPRTAKKASEFGESRKRFLWYPFLPIGEFTVLMADGGMLTA